MHPPQAIQILIPLAIVFVAVSAFAVEVGAPASKNGPIGVPPSQQEAADPSTTEFIHRSVTKPPVPGEKRRTTTAPFVDSTRTYQSGRNTRTSSPTPAPESNRDSDAPGKNR